MSTTIDWMHMVKWVASCLRQEEQARVYDMAEAVTDEASARVALDLAGYSGVEIGVLLGAYRLYEVAP